MEALQRNEEASLTDVHIFVDGPRRPSEAEEVSEVIGVARSNWKFNTTTVVVSPQNRGLAESIISGVGSVVGDYGQVIVLEDDLVVSSFFLNYMNCALRLYADDERVASVHAYVYPTDSELPSTFFVRGADCWGWGTWSRAWSKFNPDSHELLRSLEKSSAQADFDFGGSVGYREMLMDQIKGINDSWAVRWYASTFLANMLTLYPGRSLVENIGMDGSGTHGSVSRAFEVLLAEAPVDVQRIVVAESTFAREAFARYFERNRRRGVGGRTWLRLKKTLRPLWRVLPPSARGRMGSIILGSSR